MLQSTIDVDTAPQIQLFSSLLAGMQMLDYHNSDSIGQFVC